MKLRNFVGIVGLALLSVFSVPSAAFADDTIFSVEAPVGEVYTAALQAIVADMEFRIVLNEKDAGLISAEFINNFGEKAHFIVMKMDEKNGVTEINFKANKRKFFVTGGSPEKRMAEFKSALESRLGKTVEQKNEQKKKK